ncbi:MAG: ribose-phosphate diphosphokinase [Patescibacteria group bacterium]
MSEMMIMERMTTALRVEMAYNLLEANLVKISDFERIAVFSGRANIPLAQEVCDLLQIPLNIGIVEFSDGEFKAKLQINVRGRHVFIIQPTNPPAENWLELYFMIDAARRASADKITVIMPYAGFSRQERKDEPRVSISFKVMLRQIEQAGATRIVACDLHAAASQGFVDIPFDNLFVPPFLLAPFANFFAPNTVCDTCLVTDLGYSKIADVYADLLGCELVLARKKRKGPDELEDRIILVGEVKKRAIFIDDIASTFGTANRIGRAIRKAGAEYLAAVMVHPLLSENPQNPAKDVISNSKNSPFEDFVFANTVLIDQEKIRRIEKAIFSKSPRGRIYIVSCARLLAKTIQEIYERGSVSDIFEDNKRQLRELKNLIVL